MELEKPSKIKKILVLDLPKISSNSLSSTGQNFSQSQEKRIIRLSETNNFSVPKSNNPVNPLNDSSKQLKTELTAQNNTSSTLYYFKHQVINPNPLKLLKKQNSSSGEIDQLYSTFSKTRKAEHDSWKNQELKKIRESKFTKDLTNYLMKNDKNKHKSLFSDPANVTKSNLNNVNFNKLNSTHIQTLPKKEISEDKLKDNLKEFIGINKYPIDYQEINFDVPKPNFIQFEPLKTHLSNFQQNYDKRNLRFLLIFIYFSRIEF